MKRDQYSRARGGTSQMLDISCSNCGARLLSYQKDGPGRLLRCYIDRIFWPENFDGTVPFKCSGCGQLIGTPMTYKPEDRPAIRLIQTAFRKEKQ